MNTIFTKLSTTFVAGLLAAATLVLAFTASASADCYQYNANGFNTSSTPVFNNICGVPEGINNESDFVRIRQNVNTNDEDNTNNPTYTVGTLASACTTGTHFDVWNYLHNNASSSDNPDTDPSNPSAVATDVAETLSAQLGSGSKFTFGDTVTAAAPTASVSDTAVLNCGTNQVQLSLDTGSVHVYSQAYNSGNGEWYTLADSAVNNSSVTTTPVPVPVGSPDYGSGTMWGCWNYRIVIVYQVTTTAIPTPPPTTTPPVCSLLSLATVDQTAEIEKLNYVANSADITGATVVFTNASGTTDTATLSLANLQQIAAGQPYDFAISQPGSYSAKATIVSSNYPGATSTNCVATASITTPPTTPVTPAKPTALVNTGPGSVIAVFAGVSVMGAAAYRWFISRRLQKN